MSINRRVFTLCDPEDRGQSIFEFLTNSTTDGLIGSSSDERSRVVNNGGIDAIVSRRRLSGFLSDIDIIARLTRDLVRPVTILISDLPPEVKERAATGKINTVLPESSSAEAIASATMGALTRDIHGGLSIPQAARMQVHDSVRRLPCGNHQTPSASQLANLENVCQQHT